MTYTLHRYNLTEFIEQTISYPLSAQGLTFALSQRTFPVSSSWSLNFDARYLRTEPSMKQTYMKQTRRLEHLASLKTFAVLTRPRTAAEWFLLKAIVALKTSQHIHNQVRDRGRDAEVATPRRRMRRQQRRCRFCRLWDAIISTALTVTLSACGFVSETTQSVPLLRQRRRAGSRGGWRSLNI